MPKDPKGETLVRLWEQFQLERPGATQLDHAVDIGIRWSAYKSRFFRATEKRKTLSDDLFNIDIGKPWALPAGNYCIVGDVHVPSTDIDFATLPAIVSRSMGITDLIIGGDLFNMDLFSSYIQIIQAPSWKHERKAARQLIKYYLEYFENIYIILGNHDRRFQKFLMGLLDHDDLLSLLNLPKRVKMSNFGYCVVKNGNGGNDWRITHPSNYSVNQLTVVDQLALKFQQNIIGFHEHHLSKGYDRYGRYVIVNGGGLFDTESMAYVRLDDSKSPAMKNGFVVLHNDTPEVFGREPYTDWSKLV